jgi:hypothetical protein
MKMFLPLIFWFSDEILIADYDAITLSGLISFQGKKKILGICHWIDLRCSGIACVLNSFFFFNL